MISLTQVSAPTILGEDSTASGASPSLLLEDTTASAKDALLKADADKLQIRDNALADGTQLVLDMANTRLGFGVAAPLKPLHIAGPAGATGYTNNVQPQDAIVIDNANNASLNITCAATSVASVYLSTTGKSGRGAINFNFNTDKLELAAAGSMLTLPVTGNLLSTNNFEVSNTAPSIILTDTTASAKDLTIEVDADFARIRESAGAAGSLLTLDLTNNRVGIATAAPGVALEVTGAVTASGTGTFGAVTTAGALSSGTAGVTGALTAGTLAVGGGDALSTIIYGTYTPTFVSVANLDATPAIVGTFRYQRIGNTVYVSGMVQTNATAVATTTTFYFDLPIASNFANAQDCLGNMTSLEAQGTITGDSTNDRVDANFMTATGALETQVVSFMYKII